MNIKSPLLIALLFCGWQCLSQLSDAHYLPPLKQISNNAAVKQQAFYLSTPETTQFAIQVFQGTNAIPIATLNISNTTLENSM